MKRIRLFTMVAGLVALGASAFAAEVTDEQQARLAEIEQYIEVQKQNIENRYAARLAGVDYAKFSDWAKYIEEVLRLNGVDLRRDKDYARALEEYRRDQLWLSSRFKPAPKLLAIAESRLAEEQVRVRRLFALERVQIEKEKRYAIDVRLAELEAKLKDDVLNPPARSPEKTVTGIVYSQDKPIVIVGSQVVRLGEKIDKVRVTAISPDSVEFEKNGKRWTQQIGDEPGAEW